MDPKGSVLKGLHCIFYQKSLFPNTNNVVVLIGNVSVRWFKGVPKSYEQAHEMLVLIAPAS